MDVYALAKDEEHRTMKTHRYKFERVNVEAVVLVFLHFWVISCSLLRKKKKWRRCCIHIKDKERRREKGGNIPMGSRG